MDAFRATKRRGPLHPQEKLLLLFLALTAVTAIWTGRGHALWSSALCALFALVAFLVALPPRPIIEGLDEIDWSSRWRVRRLLKYPVFWVGLAFTGLVITQAARTAARANYDPIEDRWIVEPDPASLPPLSSITGPFGEATPLQGALDFGAAFLAGSAAWIGLTRRRSVLALFWVLSLNATTLALVSIARQLSRSGETLLSGHPAAAYLLLCCGLTVGLTIYYFFESKRFLQKSDPSGVFCLGIIATAAAVPFTGSAAGLALAAAIAGGFAGFIVFYLVWRRETGMSRRVGYAVFLAAMVFPPFVAQRVTSGMQFLDRRGAINHAQVRDSIHDVAGALAAERPLFGWGLGSFRYLATDRQDRQLEASLSPDPLYHQTARGDLFELPAQVGLVGCLLLAAAIVWHGWSFARGRLPQNPLLQFIAIGIAAMLVLTCRESVVTSGPVLIHFVLIITGGSLLCLMERPTRFRAPPSPVAAPPPPPPRSSVRL